MLSRSFPLSLEPFPMQLLKHILLGLVTYSLFCLMFSIWHLKGDSGAPVAVPGIWVMVVPFEQNQPLTQLQE